nr:hypothetical protein HK105_004119 [Polyrhizophydium stewartii]
MRAFGADQSKTQCVVANLDATTAPDIAERYGVQGYPTIKHFSPELDPPVLYELGRDLDSFVRFLNLHCQTNRRSDGSLNEKAGRIAELDKLAVKFIEAAPGNRPVIAQEAEVTMAATTKYGKYYVKVMQRMLKDQGFPAKESKRLQGIVDSGNTTPAKSDDFAIRGNILNVFVNGSAVVDDKDEL